MDVGAEQDPEGPDTRPEEGDEEERADASGVLAEGPAAAALGAEAAGEEASRSSWWDGLNFCDIPSCDGCDVPGCDGCDACNLLLRLSTVLAVAAALVPGRLGRRPVLALLGFYRRRLTRFTPACPSTPSCSAYAVRAVQDLGARRGLAAAARRVRRCGAPPH